MLSIPFTVSSELEHTIHGMAMNEFNGSFLTNVVSERLSLIAEPIVFGAQDMSDGYAQIRSQIAESDVSAAYVIVHVQPAACTLFVYISDSARNKERLLLSAGLPHLRGVLERMMPGVCITVRRVETPDEIVPEPPGDLDVDAYRYDLMTPSERFYLLLKDAEVVPPPSVLPGVRLSMDSEGDAQMDAFARGTLSTVSYTVQDGTIRVNKTFFLARTLEEFIGLIPINEPQFIITKFRLVKGDSDVRKPIMIYVCPSSCGAKTKMMFASAKACFLEHAKNHHIYFVRKIEGYDGAEVAQELRMFCY